LQALVYIFWGMAGLAIIFVLLWMVGLFMRAWNGETDSDHH
jgi:hypothetical protein